MSFKPGSIDEMLSALRQHRYIADRNIATSAFLAHAMGKPLLLEGEPGVGKTQLAKVLAEIFNTRLIRLQCFEGIDSHSALYEWNYPKQLLALKAQSEQRQTIDKESIDIFSNDYLLKRPLLDALIQTEDSVPPVLLIDEIDRADEEFEAFLLEILSDFQISIPELGVVKAKMKPLVILTSNGTRELHSALKRRCLFHWIEYPSPEIERDIILSQLPDIQENLAKKISYLVDNLRQEPLVKKPGTAEAIDWAESLATLGVLDITPEIVGDTLGCLLKNKRDLEQISAVKIGDLLSATEKQMGV